MNPSPLFRRSLPVTLAVVTAISMSASSAFAAATPAPQTVAQHVAAIQAKGNSDITARLASLNALIAKVAAAKKLSTAQKTSLTSEMQGEVTGLTALKAKLDADTDVATAKTDFQDIFALHYIYAFYLPRTDRIIAADDQNDAATLLTALEPKLQTYITNAKTAGKNVTAEQTAFADLQNKAADALSKSQQVISALTPLTAAGHPGNKTTVSGANAQLVAGRADLQSARTDARAIVTGLRGALGTSTVQ